MRGILLAAALGLGLGWGLSGAAQAETPLTLVAVPGLFGMEATGCGRPTGADPAFDTANVDALACASLTEARRQVLGRRFAEAVRARFPNVVDDARANLGEGQAAALALDRTAFASLHLSRVKVWSYAKPGGVIAVQSLASLRLMITNAATGEVIFVEDPVEQPRTGDFTARSFRPEMEAQIGPMLDAAVDRLVASAATHFQPRSVVARVAGRAGADYVIAAGRRAGVREGDLFGGDAEVVFSDADYAIVHPLLNEPRIGQDLSRDVAQPLEALERPSLLAVVAEAPPSMLRSEVLALVEGRLAARGFAVAPVNPNFVQIRDQAFGAAAVRYRKRTLPDYFLRVSVAALEPTVGPNVRNLDHRDQRLQEAWATLEVIDRSGRVVFATANKGRVEDRVSEDLRFNDDQRAGAAIDNALTAATEALAAQFRPSPLRLAVQRQGDLIRVLDPGGALTPGVNARVLRRVGRVPGVQGEVWAPVGDVEIVGVDAGGATARSADVADVQVRSGDVLAYSTGSETVSRRRFAACLDPSGDISVDWRSPTRQPLFGMLAVNGFASGFRGPVYMPGFDGLLEHELRSQFDGTDRLGALRPAAPDLCFRPVQAAALRSVERTRSAASADLNRRWSIHDLTVGFLLMSGGQRVAGGGVQEQVTGQEVASVSGPEQDERALQMDLATRAVALSRRAAAELAPPQ